MRPCAGSPYASARARRRLRSLFREGGRRKRHTLAQYDPPHFTLAMAREKARDIISEARLKKTEAPRTTFDEALEIYYRIHVGKLRRQSQRGIKQTIDRRFKPKLGKKILSDIKPMEIAPLLDAMIETPTEMHNAFVYLAMFFNWCMRRGYIENPPTVRMETPPRPPSRERTLTPEELVSVWKAADPDSDYGRIVRLCILTGQRDGQWAGARREYIGSDVITWPAEGMKGKRPHSLPLTDTARALLPDRVGFLFPTENGKPFSNWSRSKHRLDQASGVSGYTHQDLRRTWATISAEEIGTEPHIIEAVLHHAMGTVVRSRDHTLSPVARVYNRARYIEPMRAALIAFEEWLARQLRQGEAPKVIAS